MSNRMARAHRDTTPNGIHRVNDPPHALKSRLQIPQIPLRSQQAGNEDLQAVGRRRVALFVRLQRAQRFDAVVHGAHAGGKPDFFGRCGR